MNKNIRSKCLYSGKFLELYLDSIKQDNGKIINCSIKDEKYLPVYDPIVVEI